MVNMKYFALIVVPIFCGLLASLLGVTGAFQLISNSPVRRPPVRWLAGVCVAGALLIYPALFLALRFEDVVIAKGNPGAQGGVLAFVLAMGFCTLASLSATLALIARFK
jgi:hypothetical protein